MIHEDVLKRIKREEEQKAELKRIYPHSVIKDIPLGVLKKLAYIIELRDYSRKNKRELIHAIVDFQAGEMRNPSDIDRTIIEVEYSSLDGVCKSLQINNECDYLYYMLLGDKYQ